MVSRHVKIISRVNGFAVGINNMVTEVGRGEGNCSSIFFCVCSAENSDVQRMPLMK